MGESDIIDLILGTKEDFQKRKPKPKPKCKPKHLEGGIRNKNEK